MLLFLHNTHYQNPFEKQRIPGYGSGVDRDEVFPKPAGILKLGAKKRSQQEDMDTVYRLGKVKN